MIEKRFTVDDSGYVVIDNNSEKAFMFDTIEDCFACCDVLNEQHETIQQLKKDNKILMDKMFEMRTNDALDRTEISRQHYTVDEFLEELEKW